MDCTDCDEDHKAYVSRMQTHLMAAQRRLDVSNKKLNDLEKVVEKQKSTIDHLSAEIGRLKRIIKRQNNRVIA